MTSRRKLVLDFVVAYTKIHKCAPTMDVIAKAIGLKSRSNIHRIVKRLEADGFIETRPKKYRSIRVVDKSIKIISSL